MLQRTLDSVLSQKYADVEHLILDGLSKDNTVPMALAYKERSDKSGNDHEVVVISEKDGGLYDAMNKGVRHATGDYIVFLNAGDTFPNEDTLETIASSIGDGEKLPGVLYGDTDIVDMDHHFLRHRRLSVDYRFSADVDWCIRIMKLCAKRHLTLRNVNAVIVDYLDGGMTNKNHKASLKERFHVMAKHYGFVQTVFLHLYFVLRSVVKR